MKRDLARIVRGEGVTPLAWAGGEPAQETLDLGDALSPVMVALLSGKPVRRVPFRSGTPRLVASGTVGQNVAEGEAWFWGTGCDPRSGAGEASARFSPDPALRAHVSATRGPISGALLGGGRLRSDVFGDPVGLLPRFYRPRIEKRHELGVILDLSELAERTLDCRTPPASSRARRPADLARSIHVMNTLTPVSATGLRAKLDEILACRRILSSSLHGLVIAESYGIPCLPFARGGDAGPRPLPLTADSDQDARILDFYMGAGRTETPVYVQPDAEPTDWDAAIAAIDRFWTPLAIDDAALIEAFPLDVAPVDPGRDSTIWDHDLITGLEFRHDLDAVRDADASEAEARARREAEAASGWPAKLRSWRLPATFSDRTPPRLTLAQDGEGAVLRLSWAETPPDSGYLNLGDALSPVIVAAISGQRIVHAAFDSPTERLAAVGTIAHGQRNGVVHFWGAGLDATVNPLRRGAPWAYPADTTLHVHATRGPMSAAALRREGVDTPEIFGDPVYFLDRVFPLGEVEKTHDLGVILHLSEIEPWDGEGPPTPRADLIRYRVPEAFRDRVKIMDTRVAPTIDAMRARLVEIASCRAILSTSLHGLVIADVYGVPNAWFGFGGGGLKQIDVLDPAERLDHRVRDLYAGQGLGRVLSVQTRRERASDWDRLIGLSQELTTRGGDHRALFEAFPGPRAVRWNEPAWPLAHGLVPGLA